MKRYYCIQIQTFNKMLHLNYHSVMKSGNYSVRYRYNFIGTICKSNMRLLNVIMIALNIWNKLSNDAKLISSYIFYKVFIKAMFLDLYA